MLRHCYGTLNRQNDENRTVRQLMLRTVRDFLNCALKPVPVSETVTDTTDIMRGTSRVEMDVDGNGAGHCHSLVYIYRRAKLFFDHNFIIPSLRVRPSRVYT